MSKQGEIRLKKGVDQKRDLLVNLFEKWFAIGQKWVAVPKKFSQTLGLSDSQLPQKWFAFDDANPPISCPVIV